MVGISKVGHLSVGLPIVAYPKLTLNLYHVGLLSYPKITYDHIKLKQVPSSLVYSIKARETARDTKE